MKVRAGSLLYDLALTIDGSLTFITNMAIIPLHALEVELSRQLTPQRPVREPCEGTVKGLEVLLQLWSGRP